LAKRQQNKAALIHYRIGGAPTVGMVVMATLVTAARLQKREMTVAREGETMIEVVLGDSVLDNYGDGKRELGRTQS